MSTTCMTPFSRKNKQGCMKQVPCGRCPACLARRASGWSFRLMMEDKRSISSFFITLTYDTDHVPISKNGFMQLSKDDVQKFFKRLRKAHEKSQSLSGEDNIVQDNIRGIKYYAVGEYGGRFRRPHYHVIIFNCDLELMFSKEDIKVLEMSNFDGEAHVRCLQWDKGFASVGTVSGASVGYTLKYICKVRWKPMHINDDREREFSLMSKCLGDNYITPAMVKWHTKKLSERMYLSIEDGKKIAMPRYYKQKIYSDNQRQAIKYWTEKNVKEKEKLLLQSGKLESFKDAKARVDQEYAKMYKRAENGRNKL